MPLAQATTRKPPTRGNRVQHFRADLRGDVRLDSPIVCRDEAEIAEPNGVVVSIRVAIRLPMVST
jgi:hypothetical protein